MIAHLVQSMGLENLVILVLDRKRGHAAQPHIRDTFVIRRQPKVSNFCVVVVNIGFLNPE